jgi:cytochrome c biogenesis protein CcmG/thiol:disulfide interchange protein DsbE
MIRHCLLGATLLGLVLNPAFGLDFDALRETVQNKDLAGFQRLMREPGALDATREGFTPLHWISGGAPLEFVEYLVRLGADVNALGDKDAKNKNTDWQGSTPLMLAAAGNNLPVVKFLESKGADINYGVRGGSFTVMDTACASGSLDVVKYLFDRIPNRSISGSTSHLAQAIGVFLADSRQVRVAQFLIEHGVDLNADPEGHYGATQSIIGASLPQVFQAMLKRNVDWNRTDEWGNTPILYAAISSVNGVRELLKKGVRLDQYSADSHLNPLEVAVTVGNAYTTQMILDAGANPMTPNPTTGTTPLQLAQGLKNPDIVAILQRTKRVTLPRWTIDDEAKTGISLNYQNWGDMDLVSRDGKKTKLSAYQGRTLILNIWATWCPPCVDEMPSLQNLFIDYKTKNVLVLGQSVDDRTADAEAFAATNHLTFPLFFADFSLTNGGNSKYPSVGIPTTYVIDRRGNVTHRFVGSQDWSSPDLRRFVDFVAGL